MGEHSQAEKCAAVLGRALSEADQKATSSSRPAPQKRLSGRTGFVRSRRAEYEQIATESVNCVWHMRFKYTVSRLRVIGRGSGRETRSKRCAPPVNTHSRRGARTRGRAARIETHQSALIVAGSAGIQRRTKMMSSFSCEGAGGEIVRRAHT